MDARMDEEFELEHLVRTPPWRGVQGTSLRKTQDMRLWPMDGWMMDGGLS